MSIEPESSPEAVETFVTYWKGAEMSERAKASSHLADCKHNDMSFFEPLT